MKLRLTATILTDDDAEIDLAQAYAPLDRPDSLPAFALEAQRDLDAVLSSLTQKQKRRQESPAGVE